MMPSHKQSAGQYEPATYFRRGCSTGHNEREFEFPLHPRSNCLEGALFNSEHFWCTSIVDNRRPSCGRNLSRKTLSCGLIRIEEKAMSAIFHLSSNGSVSIICWTAFLYRFVIISALVIQCHRCLRNTPTTYNIDRTSTIVSSNSN